MEPRQFFPERDYSSDDDERGRLRLFACGDTGQGCQCAGNNTLRRLGAMLHDGDGGGIRQAVFDEFAAQRVESVQAHVHHHGLFGSRQRVPVEIHGAVLEMPGDEHAGLRVVAVRQWDAGIRGHAGSGGDARHHLEGDALRCQGLALFA